MPEVLPEDLLNADFIESTEDMCDEYSKRIKLNFTNGYELIVLDGVGDNFGLMPNDPSIFEGEDDMQKPYSIERVRYYVSKIGNL